MKPLRTLLLSLSALAFILPHVPAFGQASSFTYQGQLRQAGQPFTGMADLEFRLYDQSNGGNEIGNAQARPGWAVDDGLFQVELDFGAAAFDGNERFLEVTVDGAPLVPRQKVTATPYAQSLRGLRAEPSTVLFDGQAITANVIGGSFANELATNVRGATISGGGVSSGYEDPDFGFGEPNRVTDDYGAIGGGFGNQAGNDDADPAASAFSSVGGGVFNRASGFSSTVGGGRSNAASELSSTIGGGANNTASARGSTVSGGQNNAAGSLESTVGGGDFNTALGARSTISGGTLNTAIGTVSTIAGGQNNSADGVFSTVGGGASNEATGDFSTAGGGGLNVAAGDYSFVTGRRAKNSDAAHNGVFMFADSQNADFVSSRANAFFVRARGGAEFRVDDFGFRAYSNATGSSRAALQGRSENPAGIAIYGANNSTDSTLVLNNGGSGDIIRGFNIGALQLQLQSDGDLVIGGSLTQNSDRNRKEAIEPVDVQAVLEALRELPMFSWRYKHDREAAPHIGPMAQDFHAAFGLGSTPNGIAVVDAQGVALASLQALDQELASLSSENRALRQQLAELETRYDARIEALQERQEGDLAALRQELAMLRDLVAPRVAQETR